MKKGVLCISFDTELLWGRHDLNYTEFIGRVAKERKIIKTLLKLLEKYKVPATWAIVGHLFLSYCKPKNGIKHPEIKRTKTVRDWFDSDPATNIRQNPEWYGSDIVKIIKGVKKQEIASHSFSHTIFDPKFCTKEWADSEVAECVRLAKKSRIRLTSFVFPRNKVGHLNVLKKHGFSAFRGPGTRWEPPTNLFAKAMLAAQMLLPFPPPVFTPNPSGGMVNIPSSMYFVSARGARKYIPNGVRFQKAKRGIDAAIQAKRVFHLWTHPTDFTDAPEKLLAEFEAILKYADQERKEGYLEIESMRQIAIKLA